MGRVKGEEKGGRVMVGKSGRGGERGKGRKG
jgi:hypothetical protein